MIDTATRHARRRILRQVAGRGLAAIFITHAHRDHAGSMHAVAEYRGAPVWSSAAGRGCAGGQGAGADAEPGQRHGQALQRLVEGQAPGRPPPQRGRADRRLRGDRLPRPHSRDDRALARVRPHGRVRRHDAHGEHLHRHTADRRDARGVHVRHPRVPAQHPQAGRARGAHGVPRARPRAARGRGGREGPHAGGRAAGRPARSSAYLPGSSRPPSSWSWTQRLP